MADRPPVTYPPMTYPLWYFDHFTTAIEMLTAISGIGFPSYSSIISSVITCYDLMESASYPSQAVRATVTNKLLDIIAELNDEISNLDDYMEEATSAGELLKSTKYSFTVSSGAYGPVNAESVELKKNQLYTIISNLSMIKARLMGAGQANMGSEIGASVDTVDSGKRKKK